MKKEEKKELSQEKETSAKKNVPAKSSKKEGKSIPLKKLPSLYKKEYTQSKFEKKILKRIYIDDDKKYVESLFTESGKDKKENVLFSIPKDTAFTKKEYSLLKQLASDIKSQKNRIRWLPLIATIIFVAAVIITLSLTKNIIAKKAIQSVCETTFEAKCDIADIDISFINSFFKLHGLQIADKKSPMKNIVSVDSIVFDFNMLELLKARFVANELAIEGVATNTDRTYSGDISAKLQAKIEKKKAKKAKKEAEKSEDSAFMKILAEKSDVAIDTLKSSVTGLFDQYNPETIIKNCYAQLQTPDTAKKVEEEAKILVTKYKEKPAEIGTQVNELKVSFEDVAKIDINKLKSNPEEIKNALESINNAYTEVQKIKKTTDTLANGLKTDIATTKTLTSNIQSAIKHDTNIVSTEISKLTSIDISDGKRFISGTFDNVAYQVLGKYYPYAQKGVKYLLKAKNTMKEKEEKDNNKKKTKNVKTVTTTVTKRAEGRTITYKNDTTPKFWIKRAAGSGPNFYFDALNLTNNMNKTGKPVTANVKITFDDIDHAAKLVVDTRTNSKEPLVLADYNCDKLPLNFPTSKFGDAPGVPGIETNSNLDFVLKLYENDGFDITGTGKFTDMNITTVPFEPAFASTIYSNTLANIKSMELSATAGYTLSKGLNLNLYSDIDKQFVAALKTEMANQLSIIKEKAEQELFIKINELSNGAFGELNSFDDVKNKIYEYVEYVNNLADQLEAKRKEAENAITNAAKNAIEQTTEKAKSAAKEAAKSTLKNLLNH